MLHSYSAELHGSHLIWIDRKPANATKQRVLVVLEEPVPTQLPTKSNLAAPSPISMQTSERERIFATGKGCLGAAAREQTLAQLGQLRQDWDRSLWARQAGH